MDCKVRVEASCEKAVEPFLSPLRPFFPITRPNVLFLWIALPYVFQDLVDISSRDKGTKKSNTAELTYKTDILVSSLFRILRSIKG